MFKVDKSRQSTYHDAGFSAWQLRIARQNFVSFPHSSLETELFNKAHTHISGRVVPLDNSASTSEIGKTWNGIQKNVKNFFFTFSKNLRKTWKIWSKTCKKLAIFNQKHEKKLSKKKNNLKKTWKLAKNLLRLPKKTWKSVFKFWKNLRKTW